MALASDDPEDLVCRLDADNCLVAIDHPPPTLEQLAQRVAVESVNYLDLLTPPVRRVFASLFNEIRTCGEPRSFASTCDGGGVRRALVHTIYPHAAGSLTIRVQMHARVEQVLEFEEIARELAKTELWEVTVCSFCSKVMKLVPVGVRRRQSDVAGISAGRVDDCQYFISHDACDTCITALEATAAGSPDKAHPVIHAVPRIPPGICKFLVVDDSAFSAALLCSMVRRLAVGANIDVMIAKNGREAVERCAETSFDVVLTDMVMPGMGGAELIRHLRRATPDLVIIGVSGDDSLSETALNMGADDFLLKPLTLQCLGAVLVRNLSY